ncbi:MAG: PorT family protein [Prevotella sp.]|nr:PorT family protein [Prevotella sp.]
MKKILVSIAAMVLSLPSFAQFSSGGFSLDEESVYYGVRIGLTVANLGGDDAAVKNLNSKVGMTLAGVLGLRISHTAPVFLESGLYYTERGAKKDKFKMSYNNLEVPILVKYGIKASDDIAVLPFLGPVFACGIGGKYKYEDANGKYEVSSYDYLKRFNMGFKLGCGAEYDNLYLEAGYQFGITDISKSDDAIHSNAFFVNFGVNF